MMHCISMLLNVYIFLFLWHSKWPWWECDNCKTIIKNINFNKVTLKSFHFEIRRNEKKRKANHFISFFTSRHRSRNEKRKLNSNSWLFIFSSNGWGRKSNSIIPVYFQWMFCYSVYCMIWIWIHSPHKQKHWRIKLCLPNKNEFK